MIDALTVARGAGEQEDLDAAAGAARDQKIAGIGFAADHLGQMEDTHQAVGVAMLLGDDRVARLPIGAARIPYTVVAQAD